MYYDGEGKMMAAGAEADTPSMLSLAEDEAWIKVELCVVLFCHCRIALIHRS